MIDQIRHIFEDIAKYENNNLKANIENRLNYNLKKYLLDLDNSYNHIIDNLDEKNTIKELTK